MRRLRSTMAFAVLTTGVAAGAAFAAPCDVPAPVVSTAPVTAAPAPPLDVMHEAVSTAFVAPIAWFDRLFFTERDEVETNQSYLRFIVGPQWVNGQGLTIQRALRVKVRVPGLKQRLNLLFSDLEENDVDPEDNTTRSATFSRGTVVPVDNRQAQTSRSRAGVGYQLARFVDTDVDVETALRSQARLEVDLRVRQRFPKWWGTTSKFIVTGFWLQDTGFGSRYRFNNEHPLREKPAVLHWDNTVTQIHAVNGVVADSRLSAEIQVGETSGLSPGASIRGETRPRWRAPSYNLSVVYRKAFFRDWLFYEVEPGYNWTRNFEGGFHPDPFIAFRLEAQFRKGEP